MILGTRFVTCVRPKFIWRDCPVDQWVTMGCILVLLIQRVYGWAGLGIFLRWFHRLLMFFVLACLRVDSTTGSLVAPWTRREIGLAGLGKRHRSQTRVNSLSLAFRGNEPVPGSVPDGPTRISLSSPWQSILTPGSWLAFHCALRLTQTNVSPGLTLMLDARDFPALQQISAELTVPRCRTLLFDSDRPARRYAGVGSWQSWKQIVLT